MTNPIKQPALIVILLLAACGIHAAEPNRLSYNKPVKLTGTIIREFDMSFVDDNRSPLRDPVVHLILRLDQPISMAGKSADTIKEIDLGGATDAVKEKDLGKSHFVASGTLWPASTVHHLRPVMMTRTALERAK